MHGAIGLGDKLYRSEKIFVDAIPERRWIFFAPDCQGFPTVVPDAVWRLFEKFDGRKTVSDVLQLSRSPESALASVAFLLDRGYVGLEPSRLPYGVPDGEPDPPSAVEVWLHTTTACNLQCKYCFAAATPPTAMTREVASRIAHAIAVTAQRHNLRRVTVKFAGGEPTLALPQLRAFRSDLEARFDGLPVTPRFAVLTNGTMLGPSVLQFLERPNTSITISIDGYGSAHDTFRIHKRTGQGTWNTIVATLATLRDRGITPFIAATISEETCHTLPALLRWIRDSRFKTRLNVVRQADCTWERRPDTGGTYARVCDRLTAAFGRAFEELRSPAYTFDFVSGLRIGDLHFDRPVQSPCGLGYNHIVVKPNGRIVPCPMSINDAGVEPGQDLLEACRKSASYNPASRAAEADCLACRWFPVCAGGCPITNTRMGGSPFSRSPFCKLYQYLIPEYVKLLAFKLMQHQDAEGRRTDAYRQGEGGPSEAEGQSGGSNRGRRQGPTNREDGSLSARGSACIGHWTGEGRQ